jgi:hypothetical protein
VKRLRIFGSYLNPAVDPLGDLDVELVIGRRAIDPKLIIGYSQQSGRTFDTCFDRLFWPERELLLFLRNRSAAINITQEDVDNLSGPVAVVYSIAEDPGAIAPV